MREECRRVKIKTTPKHQGLDFNQMERESFLNDKIYYLQSMITL